MIPPCHTKAALVAAFIFSKRTAIVRPGSIVLFGGEFVEPSMHVYLWDAKGSELYMRPLIEEFCDKGIPLAAKPLGFQCLDGWTCGCQSLSLLHQLLQTDLSTDLGKFTAEHMPPAFVTFKALWHPQLSTLERCHASFLGFHCLSPLPTFTTTNLLYNSFLGAVYPTFIGPPSTPSSPIPFAACSPLSANLLCVCPFLLRRTR